MEIFFYFYNLLRIVFIILLSKFQIISEIFEDQDFTSTHARGNAENESDPTKKKKKKKKKKKSKTLDQGGDSNDHTEEV